MPPAWSGSCGAGTCGGAYTEALPCWPMRVSFGGGMGFGLGLSCTCVRCGAEREVPERGPRMPAHGPDPDEGITVTADTRCRCGAQRVRIRLEFEDGDCEEEDPSHEGDRLD